MTTPDPIEARLDAIEAAYAVYDDYHQDIAWLVGLVRLYRRALETIAGADDSWMAEDLSFVAREALNEEVP